MASTKSNAQAAGLGVRECLKLAAVDVPENNKPRADVQSLPSRATLARKWPRLRLNRFTGAWRDDNSGARGDTIESLLAYLAGGAQ